MEERWNMKINRQFEESDNLRKKIEQLGWIIKDEKNSYSYRKKQ